LPLTGTGDWTDEDGVYEGIVYRVVRRPVKYARVEIWGSELLVIMPEGMSVEDIFRRRGGQILKRFHEVERIRSEANGFISQGEINLLDRRFKVNYRCSNGRRGVVLDEKKEILSVCSGDEERLKKVLKDYLRENIVPIVEKYSEKTGLEPGKIYIREQKTRWGSCSARRNLSFNLRLVFLPPLFLEYIVAHEVMHLRHLNHSQQFWEELADNYGHKIPDRKEKMRYWYVAELSMESLFGPLRLCKKLEEMRKDRVLASTIRSRLGEFKEVFYSSSSDWFSELCFCILTANTSADMGIRIQQVISPEEFMTMSEEEIIERLHSLHARFYRMRGHYIHSNQRLAPILKEKVREIAGNPGESGYESEKKAREWLVENVKGFGYKEASHFLRNVGYRNLAILDKHILRLMKKYGLIDEIPTMTAKRYLETEKRLRSFGDTVGMSMAELDLYLWYMATGTVKK